MMKTRHGSPTRKSDARVISVMMPTTDSVVGIVVPEAPP